MQIIATKSEKEKHFEGNDFFFTKTLLKNVERFSDPKNGFKAQNHQTVQKSESNLLKIVISYTREV